MQLKKLALINVVQNLSLKWTYFATFTFITSNSLQPNEYWQSKQ